MTVLLLGCGDMAAHHFRVLQALGHDVIVIGRGESSAARFTAATGQHVTSLSLDDYLQSAPIPTHAIAAVTFEALAPAATRLIRAGVRNILLEKPGAVSAEELSTLTELAQSAGTRVRLGYNRRFYGSVLAAKALIAEDGGVTSCRFDFTEWSHQVTALPLGDFIKQRWVIANSTHVMDLAFHVIGAPATFQCFTNGHTSWHSASAVFVGSGTSARAVPFSYHANWNGPGRWMCEFVTSRHKLIFQPLEVLQIMKHGSVAVTVAEPANDLDNRFKAGVFLQDQCFLEGRDDDQLCSLEEQLERWPIYTRIANYRP